MLTRLNVRSPDLPSTFRTVTDVLALLVKDWAMVMLLSPVPLIIVVVPETVMLPVHGPAYDTTTLTLLAVGWL